MHDSTAPTPNVVSRTDWLAARKQLLVKEKAATRLRDSLAAERRQLPWVEIDQPYGFHDADGQLTLADLFEGRSQLVVYHFMFGPDWEEGCRSCSMAADAFDAAAVHLAQRDVSFVTVSRAPYERLAEFQRRLGWKFRWVSSLGSTFNRDFGVQFTPEEVEAGTPLYNFGSCGPYADESPGLSVFYRGPDQTIYHTYSTYGRGAEGLLMPYYYLDLVPKGRDEAGLPWPMAWVRHHDRYEQPAAV